MKPKMHANIHLNAISRNGGKRNAAGAAAYRSGSKIQTYSAVGAAAYRSGQSLYSKAQKETFNYTNKQNVEVSEMLVPDHAPDWARDRQSYWNAVETKEKRKDALLAKEAVLVLPRNLTTEQQKEVVENWAKKNLVEKRGLVVDYAIHNPEASDGERNPHAHVLYYPRPILENGEWGMKLTGYKTHNTVDGTKVLKEFRQSYEDELNAAVKSGNDSKEKAFDLRSYREKGIDRIPQPKKGKKVTQLERKGYQTKRAAQVQMIMERNAAMAGTRKHVATYSLIGARNKSHTGGIDKPREEIADAYYDIMYGDGTLGSYEKEQENER